MRQSRSLVFTLAVCGLLVACGGGDAPAPGAAADSPAATAGTGGRDVIRIVGSSTVYPFTTKVAESFGRKTDHKTPVIESTGTGGGFKLFCAGVGVDHPDMTNASRAIKSSEVEQCATNGVDEITEVKIGYDGIVVANATGATSYSLTREQLFAALVKQVPTADGQLQPNPHRSWRDVDAALPATPIEVYGPPPTSGTRDAFLELVMEPGCKATSWVADLEDGDKDRFRAICHALREDGAFIEAGENDNLIVQKLAANPDALGIFGFSFLDANRDKVQGATVDASEPTFDNIAAGSYPVSRPLFVYVKKAHVGVIPGMEDFVAELVSPAAIGEEGYLTDIGLVPLPSDELATVVADAESMADNV